jgi:hypothetical protein
VHQHRVNEAKRATRSTPRAQRICIVERDSPIEHL